MIYRYRFISEHHATYGVALICRVLAVPRRQGYYEWLAALPARQQVPLGGQLSGSIDRIRDVVGRRTRRAVVT